MRIIFLVLETPSEDFGIFGNPAVPASLWNSDESVELYYPIGNGIP